VSAATTFATELEELQGWVAAVRQLPRFLRTKDARALLEALEALSLDGLSFEDVAVRVGRGRDALLASLRRCPFGVSFE
jgi:hypothetical protein